MVSETGDKISHTHITVNEQKLPNSVVLTVFRNIDKGSPDQQV